MRWALAGSAAMHALAGTLLLVGGAGEPAGLPDDVPPVEVELIQQAPVQQGGSNAEAAPPPAAPEAAATPGQGSPAPPPSPPAPAPRAGTPAVHLGDGDRDLEGLSVTGEHIVPPSPDAVFRNRPPSYPLEAARRGAEGTVHLLVRVSAAGVPDDVRVAGSSGTASLDRAARDAVLLWRFRPARSGGGAVPFDYRLDIRFKLGD